jgi:cell division protein FtsB
MSIEELQAENARLKAEVERLTKAGDAMAEIFKNEMDNEPDCVGYLQEKLVNRWNDAKEGKPRA